MRENREFKGKIPFHDFYGNHNDEKTAEFSKKNLMTSKPYNHKTS